MREGGLFPNLRLAGLTVPDARIADFRGRLLILNVWATWCPPCRRELPGLVALQRSLPRDRLIVVTLSVDDDPELAREYLRQREIGLPAYIDRGRDIARRLLGIRVFPDTFLISPEGVLLRRIAGGLDWRRKAVVEALRRAVEEGDVRGIRALGDAA